MPTGDWYEARESGDTWDMPVKPPNSGDQDLPPVPAAPAASGVSTDPSLRVPDPTGDTETGYAAQKPDSPSIPPRRPRRPGWGLLVLGVVIAAVAWGGTQAGAIEDHFARPAFDVASISTSASDKAHPSANLTDPWNNTWWGPGTTAPGATLNALFRHPVNLADVAITPGAGPTAKDYRSEDSPASLTMTLVGPRGSSTTQTLRLPGSPGPRIFPVHADGITEVRFTITSVNAEAGPGSQVAIADIEFFSR